MTHTIAHATFGVIEFDPADVRNGWETTVEHAGRTVRIDMTFDGATMRPDVLDGVARFVTDLVAFDALARQAMRCDAAELTRDYLDFDGADDLLRTVFGADAPDPIAADTFLAPMLLVRVGLYPGEPGTHAVFDYTLGRDLTDHLMAVTFDAAGTVTGVAVES